MRGAVMQPPCPGDRDKRKCWITASNLRVSQVWGSDFRKAVCIKTPFGYRSAEACTVMSYSATPFKEEGANQTFQKNLRLNCPSGPVVFPSSVVPSSCMIASRLPDKVIRRQYPSPS